MKIVEFRVHTDLTKTLLDLEPISKASGYSFEPSAETPMPRVFI